MKGGPGGLRLYSEYILVPCARFIAMQDTNKTSRLSQVQGFQRQARVGVIFSARR